MRYFKNQAETRDKSVHIQSRLTKMNDYVAINLEYVAVAPAHYTWNELEREDIQ